MRFSIILAVFQAVSRFIDRLPLLYEFASRVRLKFSRSLAIASLSAAAITAMTGCSGQLTSLASEHARASDSSSSDSASLSPIMRVRKLPIHNPPKHLPQPITTTTLPTEQAVASSAFVDSVGVVTHLSYTDTPYYTQFAQILSALQSSGIRHIRDGYYPWAASNPIVQAHQQLAASGIKCDYVIPYNLSTTPQAIEQFAPMAGDMGSLEGSNECDISGECGGMGAAGVNNVVAFMPVVYQAGQALGVPVFGPSLTQQASYSQAGNISSEMTANNLHIYFGGRNPGSNGWGASDSEGNSYGSFAWWLDQASIDGPGMPSVITETGYVSSETTSTPYTLPDSVEASYAPRTLLLAYKSGIKQTFLYELLDEVSSPGYGLLNSDLSPKPAFTAVQNLLSTLSDDGGSFTAGALPYQIVGGDSNVNHLLLQKSDGSYWLVLWLEEPSWDPANVVSIPVAAENIGIQLSGGYTTTTNYQFDSTGNVVLFPQSTVGGLASLTVTDQVSIVRIVPQ